MRCKSTSRHWPILRAGCLFSLIFSSGCLVEFKTEAPDASGDSATVVDTLTQDDPTDTGTGTGREEATDSDPNGDSDIDSTTLRDSETDTGKEEADAGTDTRDTDTLSDTGGGTDTETVNETATETATETTVPPDTGSEKETDTPFVTDSQIDSATVTDTETDTETTSEPVDTGSEPDSDTGSEPDSDTGSEPDSDTGSEPDSDTGSEPDSDTGSEPETDTGSETETDTVSESDTPSETDPVLTEGQDYALFVNYPPNINGKLGELMWDLGTPVDVTASGTRNNNVFFDAVWDETYLYLAVEVTDSSDCVGTAESSWWYDSVEIYIDPNNSKSAGCGPGVAPNYCYDAMDVQIVVKYSDDTSWHSFGDSTQNVSLLYEATGLKTADGYIIEARIPWAGLGVTPAAKLVIGFDIGVNDDDAPCTSGGAQSRDSELRWYGDVNNYQTTVHFGELVLFAQAVN